MTTNESRRIRIAEIGKRANALMKSGHWPREDVEFVREQVRMPACVLSEIELLLVWSEETAAEMRAKQNR